MNSTFNMTAWLVQTIILTGLFLLLIPVLKTLLGLLLIALGNGLSLKNQKLRNTGLLMLPTFMKALLGLGVGIGIGGLVAAPASALPAQSTIQVSNQLPNLIQVQPGDSLWNIALEHLRAQKPEVTVGEVDGFWRLLWDLNRDAIGDDPGRLRTGVTLKVPANEQVKNAIN